MPLCRKLDLFSDTVVGIDGSKFKAVNNRDKNYTPYEPQCRIDQIEASIARYLSAMEAADRQESETTQAKSLRRKEKIPALREQMQQFRAMEEVVRAAPDRQVSVTDPDETLTVIADRGYFKGEEILACEQAGVTPLVPKPLTSGAKPKGGSGSKTSSTFPKTTCIAAQPGSC